VSFLKLRGKLTLFCSCEVDTVWTQSVSPSVGDLDVEGYTRYDTGGCLVDFKDENLALNKPTEQSSTYENDLDEYGPSRAVDGKFKTFSHSSDPSTGVTTWWQVDLEDLYEITGIVIFNRQDCCFERLNDFWIRLIDADGSTVDERYITTAVNYYTEAYGWKENILARYVRVDMPYKDDGYLHMAEVQVYGKGFNELGSTSGGSLQDCADGCNADATCISFEYSKDGTACQRSTTCKEFGLTVNNPAYPYDFYLKNVSCITCMVTCMIV